MYNSYWLARSGTWRREAGAQPSCVLALGFLAVACAKGPATQPDADSLVEWLMVSQTAQAIGAAALNQSWLSEAPAQIADLRAVMAATDTEGIAELEETLGPVAGDTRLLLAALRQRRPGSTRGDLAHWVAVALLTFSDSEPDLGRMPDNDQWDCEYLANIMDLRAIANRGTLANVSRPAMLELEPPPANLLFKPLHWNLRVSARAANSALPVFPAPAQRPQELLTIAGTFDLQEAEVVAADEHRVVVRRSGLAQARVEYVKTIALYEIATDGQLRLSGTFDLSLHSDQTLFVLAADNEVVWVWLDSGKVAAVPRECCRVLEPPDTLLWLRLLDTELKGKWLPVPNESFQRVSWEEYYKHTNRTEEPKERPDRYPPLGAFGVTDTGRPEIAGARLIYWRRGVAQDEPLVVLHGFPGLGSAYLRAALTETVGQDWQLFFYDQRGSGYSDGADDPSSLTMQRMVDDLELIRERSERGKIDIAGHAFGGLLA